MTVREPEFVLQGWLSTLTFQQQTVLLTALRGPDGEKKHTAFKQVLRAFRATILKSAKYGRPLHEGEGEVFLNTSDLYWLGRGDDHWDTTVMKWLGDCDDANIHHFTHFMQGAEVIGYKHPEEFMRKRWLRCYGLIVETLHLNPETEEQMDRRLNDFGRKCWEYNR